MNAVAVHHTPVNALPARANKPAFFQPKLQVNQPGDVYEQQADTVADSIMRMPNFNGGSFFRPSPVISNIQRKCHTCEEEEKIQRKCAECEKEEQVQRKEMPDGIIAAGAGMVQRACGAEQIGVPADCNMPEFEPPFSPRYMFNQNCDTFSGDNETDLRIDAQTYTEGDTIEIHGIASQEGDPAYNVNLSCARAREAREVIEAVLQERNIHVNTILYAHGAITGEPLSFNRSIGIVRYTHGQPVTEEPPVPENPEPVTDTPAPAPGCGGIDDFFRTVLLIDPNIIADTQTCLCFGAGIADLIPIPGVGTNPIVEYSDCACNIYTALQEVYKRGTPDNRGGGGCFEWSNYTLGDVGALAALAGIAYIDCASLPIGAALGSWLGALTGLASGAAGGAGAGGAAGGPPGAVAGGAAGAVGGAVIGTAIMDMLVDLVAMGLQNYITQGTPLPAAQMDACGRLFSRIAAPVSPGDEPGVGPGERMPDGTWFDEEGNLQMGPGPKW